MMPSARALSLVAGASLVALILLSLAWELWLAPLRPGGSWLVLKALPLLLPLMGIFKGRRYTYQWASMFILLYFIEGVMRAWSDPQPAATLALAEIALTLMFYLAAIGYAKKTAPSKNGAV